MAIYTDQELSAANAIVRALFERSEEIEFPENLSIEDVENNAILYIEDLALLDFIELDAPALRVGKETIPIALPSPIRPLNSKRPPFFDYGPYPIKFYKDWVRAYLNSEFGEYVSIPTKEAREIFQRLAGEFLAVRTARLRILNEEQFSSRSLPFLNVFRRVRGPRISSPGCIFTVTTNSPGLRVWWSGGYVISATFFGHPTSPTSSILQAGNYIFGVDGGAYGTVNKNWDTSGMVTLPGTPYYHLNF